MVKLAVRPMDEECAHRNALHQLRHPAHVIFVKMSDEHRIDATQSSTLRRRGNAVRVAEVVIRPPGVDQ